MSAHPITTFLAPTHDRRNRDTLPAMATVLGIATTSLPTLHSSCASIYKTRATLSRADKDRFAMEVDAWIEPEFTVESHANTDGDQHVDYDPADTAFRKRDANQAAANPEPTHAVQAQRPALAFGPKGSSDADVSSRAGEKNGCPARRKWRRLACPPWRKAKRDWRDVISGEPRKPSLSAADKEFIDDVLALKNTKKQPVL